MAFDLKKGNLNEVCEIIKGYMEEGKTLERFLADFRFSKRKWKKFVSKNKKLQLAIEDGLVFYKAFWQTRLSVEMNRRSGNPTLAKMAFENALGWTDSAQKREDEEKPSKRYKVYLDLRPEKEDIEDVPEDQTQMPLSEGETEYPGSN
jgi:hypothetical protein